MHKANSALANLYGDDFYSDQMRDSSRAAIKYVQILSRLYRPRSVVDVGCGRGTWLKAFRDGGAESVVGFDGTWNSQGNMIDSAIVFFGVDLNQPIPIADSNTRRFDLAVSLEVAEHLAPASAMTFVRSLSQLSDVVLFGAAYTAQGGTGHLNEQPNTYWANLFSAHGYAPIDLFRPIVWGDPEIVYWYQQNAFLYVKLGSAVAELFYAAQQLPMQNIRFMDCVHPALYGSKIQPVETADLVKQLLGRAIPGPLRKWARRMKAGAI